MLALVIAYRYRPDVTLSPTDGVFYLTWTTTAQKTFFFSHFWLQRLYWQWRNNQYAINGVFASPYGSNEILVNSVFSGFVYPAVLNTVSGYDRLHLIRLPQFPSVTGPASISQWRRFVAGRTNGNYWGTDGNSSQTGTRTEPTTCGWLGDRMLAVTINPSTARAVLPMRPPQVVHHWLHPPESQDAVLTNWTAYAAMVSMIHLIQNSTAGYRHSPGADLARSNLGIIRQTQYGHIQRSCQSIAQQKYT